MLEYIEFFKSIDPDKFCEDKMGDDEGRLCSLSYLLKSTLSIEKLTNIFQAELKKSIMEVNDDRNLGSDPKERILNALREVCLNG